MRPHLFKCRKFLISTLAVATHLIALKMLINSSAAYNTTSQAKTVAIKLISIHEITESKGSVQELEKETPSAEARVSLNNISANANKEIEIKRPEVNEWGLLPKNPNITKNQSISIFIPAPAIVESDPIVFGNENCNRKEPASEGCRRNENMNH